MSKLQLHILPSVEMLMRLWAFCVPTTLALYTGCVWALALSGLRWTGVRLLWRLSHRTIWPL